VAGDEPEAKAAVLALVADLGLTGLDVGPLVHARLLEGLVLLRHEIAARNPMADTILGVVRACG
jgi:predicted dinucleotide-binding enzyme